MQSIRRDEWNATFQSTPRPRSSEVQASQTQADGEASAGGDSSQYTPIPSEIDNPLSVDASASPESPGSITAGELPVASTLPRSQNQPALTLSQNGLLLDLDSFQSPDIELSLEEVYEGFANYAASSTGIVDNDHRDNIRSVGASGDNSGTPTALSDTSYIVVAPKAMSLIAQTIPGSSNGSSEEDGFTHIEEWPKSFYPFDAEFGDRENDLNFDEFTDGESDPGRPCAFESRKGRRYMKYIRQGLSMPDDTSPAAIEEFLAGNLSIVRHMAFETVAHPGWNFDEYCPTGEAEVHLNRAAVKRNRKTLQAILDIRWEDNRINNILNRLAKPHWDSNWMLRILLRKEKVGVLSPSVREKMHAEDPNFDLEGREMFRQVQVMRRKRPNSLLRHVMNARK